MGDKKTPAGKKEANEFDNAKSIRMLPKLVIKEEETGENLQSCSEKEWDASEQPFSAELLNVKNAPNRVSVFSGPCHSTEQLEIIRKERESPKKITDTRAADMAKMMSKVFDCLVAERDKTKIKVTINMTVQPNQ